MSSRKKWLLIVGGSLFLPTFFCAFFSHRSESKVDQFVVPIPVGGGSVVVDSHLGWLNIYKIRNFRSKRPHALLKGLPAKNPTVIAFRDSLFQSNFRPDYSYEWKGLRKVSFLGAAFGFAICLLLILIDGRGSNRVGN